MNNVCVVDLGKLLVENVFLLFSRLEKILDTGERPYTCGVCVLYL